MILSNIIFVTFIFIFAKPVKAVKESDFFKTQRLIQVHPHVQPQWMNQSEILVLIRDRKKYFDITNHIDHATQRNKKRASHFSIPQELRMQLLTKEIQKKVNMKRAEDLLKELTSFHTRFFLTTTGVQAGKLLKSHLESIIIGSKNNIQLEEVDHVWDQPSLIVRIKGTENLSEIIVAGAHYDSINQDDPFNGRSPGADDNGTGVATLVEILRTLVEMQYKPKRTIEFHFYAAEEAGLLGSLDIAFKYRIENRNVVGMLCLDMIGYKGTIKDNISIVTDYIDIKLSNLLRLCFQNYTKYSTVDDKCGFACSDHASWDIAGFRSAYPAEKEWVKGYHTEKDLVDDVDFDFLLQYAKASIAFLIELSEA